MKPLLNKSKQPLYCIYCIKKQQFVKFRSVGTHAVDYTPCSADSNLFCNEEYAKSLIPMYNNYGLSSTWEVRPAMVQDWQNEISI